MTLPERTKLSFVFWYIPLGIVFDMYWFVINAVLLLTIYYYDVFFNIIPFH